MTVAERTAQATEAKPKAKRSNAARNNTKERQVQEVPLKRPARARETRLPPTRAVQR
tara:strand:- start:11974 stop:12144 length:171 start_codon:yes stop_codon:yes gene_type:complete